MADMHITTSESHEVMQALTELRTEVEAKSVSADKVEKINAFLDKSEAKHQEVTRKFLEAEKRAAELEEKMHSLEASLSKPSNGADDLEVKRAEVAAFDKWIQYGDHMLGADEVKLLQTGNNAEGGYLVPVDYVSDLIKGITEISPVRQIARIRQTTRNEVQIPVRSSLLAAGWVGENVPDTLSNSTYGLNKISVNKIQVTVPATQEILRDSAFDMNAEIASDAIERFGQIEGAAFINGSGTGTQPQGILTNGDVGTTVSGNATALTADAFFNIQGDIIDGYNLTWMFNRRTAAAIRTLKNLQNDYLLQPGLNGAAPGTVAGLPYVLANDMPDIAANAFPIVLGDWFRSYTIVDNTNIEMIRDDFSQKRQGVVEFTFFKRVGGQVTLPEGIRKMQIAV